MENKTGFFIKYNKIKNTIENENIILKQAYNIKSVKAKIFRVKVIMKFKFKRQRIRH